MANGISKSTEAKNYNAFKTKKGRTVYDGGGIQPDIELEESKTSTIAEALQKNDAIFNFATQYLYKNPNLGDKIPNLTDLDFVNFKSFLKTQNFAMDTKTEMALKEVMAQAKKESLDKSIQMQFDALTSALQKAEDVELEKNKSEILTLLKDEIIKRLQYKEGLYLYYSKNNTEIKRATQLLNNMAEYNKILLR